LILPREAGRKGGVKHTPIPSFPRRGGRGKNCPFPRLYPDLMDRKRKYVHRSTGVRVHKVGLGSLLPRREELEEGVFKNLLSKLISVVV